MRHKIELQNYSEAVQQRYNEWLDANYVPAANFGASAIAGAAQVFKALDIEGYLNALDAFIGKDKTLNQGEGFK